MKKQSGFTLVEVAIVLVIIGLLLGTILKGQELITSARVRNMADQNAAVQAAYYGFLDRFRQVPGDMRADTVCRTIGNTVPGCSGNTGGVGGDGNGRIGNPGSADWGEASAVWAHLSAAGFLQGSYDGSGTTSTLYETNLLSAPANIFRGKLLLTRSIDYAAPTSNPATYRLNLVLGKGSPVGVLSELDRKIDDGIPNTGILRNALSTATYSPISTSGDTASCVISSGSGDATGGTTTTMWDVNGTSSSSLDDCNSVYLY